MNLDNIQTLYLHQLGGHISTLSPAAMQKVARAINFALGLDLIR